jgi:hypothetical protein
MEMLGFSNLFGSTFFRCSSSPPKQERVDLRSCLDEAILAYDWEDSLERR